MAAGLPARRGVSAGVNNSGHRKPFSNLPIEIELTVVNLMYAFLRPGNPIFRFGAAALAAAAAAFR